MKKFECQHIRWLSQHQPPMDRINELASEGWSVVAGGGGGNSANYHWVMMQREVVQSDFNKSSDDE